MTPLKYLSMCVLYIIVHLYTQTSSPFRWPLLNWIILLATFLGANNDRGKNKWFFKSWWPSCSEYIPAASILPATQGLDEELPYIQPPPAECLETFASVENPSRKKRKMYEIKRRKIVWLFLLEVNPKVQCFPECWSILLISSTGNARPNRNHIQCPLLQQLPHLISPSMLSVAWDMLGSLFCHSDLKPHSWTACHERWDCPMTLKPRFN